MGSLIQIPTDHLLYFFNESFEQFDFFVGFLLRMLIGRCCCLFQRVTTLELYDLQNDESRVCVSFAHNSAQSGRQFSVKGMAETRILW